MNDNIRACADHHAGEGGYSESTREKYEAAVEERIKSLETNLKIMAESRMNERIKELAEQASHQSPDGYPVTIPYSKDFAEKFAELIVKECMRQVEEQYKPVIEDEAMMKDEHWKGYKHCGVDSIVAIRKHFGVEE